MFENYYLEEYLEVTKKVNRGVHKFILGHKYEFTIKLHQISIKDIVNIIQKENIAFIEISDSYYHRILNYIDIKLHHHDAEDFRIYITKLKENNSVKFNNYTSCNIIIYRGIE